MYLVGWYQELAQLNLNHTVYTRYLAVFGLSTVITCSFIYIIYQSWRYKVCLNQIKWFNIWMRQKDEIDRTIRTVVIDFFIGSWFYSFDIHVYACFIVYWWTKLICHFIIFYCILPRSWIALIVLFFTLFVKINYRSSIKVFISHDFLFITIGCLWTWL